MKKHRLRTIIICFLVLLVVAVSYLLHSERNLTNIYNDHQKENLVWELRSLNNHLFHMSITLDKYEEVSTDMEKELFTLLLERDLKTLKGIQYRLSYLYFDVYETRETPYHDIIIKFPSSLKKAVEIKKNDSLNPDQLKQLDKNQYSEMISLLQDTKSYVGSLIYKDINFDEEYLFDEETDGLLIISIQETDKKINEILSEE